jgi:hypothetical protein
MSLAELAEKGAGDDVVRELLAHVVERLMEFEIERRTRWIGKGTPWRCEDIEPRPLGWDAEQQLMNLAELN